MPVRNNVWIFIAGCPYTAAVRGARMTMKRQTGNRTVLITGAAGGLGAALSFHCARAGFNTVMLDNNQKELGAAWDAIVAGGCPEPALHPLDLATAGPEQFDELVDALKSEFGGLDAVIHCAARFKGLRPLDQVQPPEWLQQIQVNLNAAWLLSSSCLPLLRQSAPSCLYFLLEDMQRMEGAFWGAYGVSKHALKALVSQFAEECASTGIQVLGINPGAMATPLRAEAYHAENPATLPSADVAAEKIMELLSGRERPAEVFVKLN
jgi:NAD(P)-dependent dehydrogenase (short-subunit alcohol dehydrogenase family)